MLVRNGQDTILQDPRGEECRHTLTRVYSEMILTVAMNYNSAPNVLDMDLDEIEFFYNGIRADLKRSTSPKGD